MPAMIVGALTLLRAQQPTGEIRLTIKDPSGSGMQASGKLGPTAFRTDSSGQYTFTGLSFGHYQLEVSAPGFASQSLPIEVQSPAPILRTVTLALAQAESKLDVVATTPLPGVNLSVNQVPAPVQVATHADIEASGALDLSDFLSRRMNGVYLNEMQGNPFQPDVNFRGYTASPLLGTPQGIAVYLDGVRQNQPFGDVVSWDLIPQNAISSMTLVPGSDPLFGLNTLGGALSIQSKDGSTSPGLSGNATYGSSGRKALQAEAGGGAATGFNWFLSANAFHESGWRYDSPSDVRQGFARLGRRTAATDLGLTLSYAYNTMTGNGLQDYRLLARDYSSIYTAPDTISNRAPAFNFLASHTFSPSLTFSGIAYYRNIRSENINGNLNTNSLDESVYQPSAADIAALKAAGYTGYPASGANASNTPFPKWRCIAQALEFNEPVEKCDAVIVYSKTAQNDFGFSGQLTWLSAKHNQLTAGATFDRGTVTFTQNTQFGYLNPDRTITGIASWEDGSTNSNGTPVDSRVNLYGVDPTFSLFATDTWSVRNNLNLTFSGRYNRNTIDNSDRLLPQAGPGSLTGRDVFNRFNPAVGLTWSPVSAVNVYASYIQGNRAPTSIELGCADPLDPCNLPNALASDPPLKQVVTATWQAGVRGKAEHHNVHWNDVHWNLGAFTAENSNDILFVASQQTGTGYFKNFGKTRRRGVEASVDGRVGRVTGGLDYTLLEATYESTETVDGTANNTSDIALSGFPGVGGVITIHPGNRIPLVPKQTGKAYLSIQATSKFVLDFNLHAASSSYARGNENNAYKADGKYYLGPGTSPGYAVLNFRAHYDLTRRLQLAGQVDNLFDRHYYTAAQLANTGLTAQGTFIARQFPAYTTGDQAGNYPIQSATFVAPGAPRRAWAELRLRF
jgi:outer membrane receptor protein involved in Fe transport